MSLARLVVIEGPDAGREFELPLRGGGVGRGEGNLVQVNLGSDDQIQPGDFMVVYRDSPIAGQPRQILGEIGILTTERRTATGRIVQSRRAMQIGDQVEMR